MKYGIKTIPGIFDEIEAESPEEALVAFATKMDLNMGAYFKAVPVEEEDSNVHILTEEEAEEIAEEAAKLSDCHSTCATGYFNIYAAGDVSCDVDVYKWDDSLDEEIHFVIHVVYTGEDDSGSYSDLVHTQTLDTSELKNTLLGIARDLARQEVAA